jgi:hypothetical protein
MIGQAQELKTKKNYSQYYTDIYQVEKQSKLKLGTYHKIHNQSKDTLVTGQYENDSVTGVWTYFSKGNQPYLKYDYSIDSCLWISELENKPDTFPVRISNDFEFAKLDRPPFYIGFKNELEMFFANRIKLPLSLMENGANALYMASFVVSKEGNLGEIQAEKMENNQFREAVLEAFKEINGKWLPGIMNGNQVDTKLYVIFDISPAGQEPKVTKKPYVLNIDIRYFGTKRAVSTRIVSTSGSNSLRSNMPGSLIIRR